MTYTLIAHTELGSAQGSITFSSIPQTFTDLVIKISIRSDVAASVTGVTTFIRPNGSTASFTSRALYGSGSAASSFTSTAFNINNPSNYTANTFSNSEIYIPNYAGSTNKSLSTDTLNENNGTTADMAIWAGLWSNTAAITSLSIVPEGGNFVSGSSATLYGITAGSSGGVVVS